jgi:hypothetical protein
MWSASRSGRNKPVELLYLSDSRLRNLVTNAPMPPFPHTSLCRSTELRLQTVPVSGMGQRRSIVSCTRPNYVMCHHTFTCIRYASRHSSTNCWRCDYRNTNKQAEDNNWSNERMNKFGTKARRLMLCMVRLLSTTTSGIYHKWLQSFKAQRSLYISTV